jgi:DNA polymerase III delta prime subunit
MRRIIGVSAGAIAVISIVILIAVDTFSNFIPISSGIIGGTIAFFTYVMHFLGNTETVVSLWRDTSVTQRIVRQGGERSRQQVEDYLRRMIRRFEEDRVSFVHMEYTTNIARMTKRSPTDSQTFSNPVALYNNYRQFILIGLPGVGKSTVLRELFCELARFRLEEISEPIPLWIDLSDPTNPVDAHEMFRYWCESPQKYNLNVGFETMLQTCSFVLMLDGLNEMPLNHRKERARSLQEWIEEHDEVRVIITCRMRDYQDDANIHLGRVSQVYIEPFERAQIVKFLEGAVPEKIAERMLREVERDDAIFRLAQIPLHLGMLTQLSIWWQDQNNLKKLPNRSKTLFEEYLKTRYDYEQRKKRINFKWSKLQKKLEKLAYKMVEPGRRKEGSSIATSEKQVKRIIGRKAISDSYNLHLLTQNASVEDNHQNNTIQFFHQSLHGYFALPRLERSIDQRYNRWWMPFFRASPARTAAIIRQIGDLGDTAEIAVDTLLPLIKNSDETIQTASINALIDIGLPAISPLVKQLTSDNELIVKNTIYILRKIGRPILGPLLIYALKNDNQTARRRVAAVLDHFDVPYKLTKALRDSEAHREDFRGYIASVLGELGSSRAVQPLIPLLKDDDETVRGDIAWALGEIGDETAIKPLVEMIQRERTQFGQMYAAYAIEQIGVEALVALCKSIREVNKQKRKNIVNTLRYYIFKTDEKTLYNVGKAATSERNDWQQLLRRVIENWWNNRS